MDLRRSDVSFMSLVPWKNLLHQQQVKDEARVARETEQPGLGTHKGSSRIFSTSQFRHHLVVLERVRVHFSIVLVDPTFLLHLLVFNELFIVH